MLAIQFYNTRKKIPSGKFLKIVCPALFEKIFFQKHRLFDIKVERKRRYLNVPTFPEKNFSALIFEKKNKKNFVLDFFNIKRLMFLRLNSVRLLLVTGAFENN